MKKIIVLLFLIAGACHCDAQFNILTYGAVKDTLRLSTVSINKAVEACYRLGGGTVIIPAGNYRSGTITLKDNVHLELQAGATLYASRDKNDFPRQKQPEYRSQKDPGGWFSLIYAEGAQNIGISGKGTINGQGAGQTARPGFPGGDLDGRPRNILFISCKKVSVEGITMMNAGIWNQHYLNCEDVMVSRVNVFNHANRNNDGIDIDGCRRVVISDCIIDSDDDAIVLKSTGTAGCEDVAVTNCIVSSFCNAIKCGTESTGGFKNISVSNCVVRPSRSKSASVFGWGQIGITGISLEIVDGGIMDGVTISNIVIEGTDCPVYVRLGNRARKHNPSAPDPGPGQMRNIMISNITAYNTGNYGSSVTGVPGAKIENLSLNNIHIVNQGGVKAGEYLPSFERVPEDEKGYPQPTAWKNLPAYGFFIRHVKNISISDLTLGSKEDDPRPPLAGIDIDDLRIHQFNIEDKSYKINILLKDVRHLVKDSNINQVLE